MRMEDVIGAQPFPLREFVLQNQVAACRDHSKGNTRSVPSS